MSSDLAHSASSLDTSWEQAESGVSSSAKEDMAQAIFMLNELTQLSPQQCKMIRDRRRTWRQRPEGRGRLKSSKIRRRIRSSKKLTT